MPIEFRCSNCNRLLRTGDEAVGRQAQCPECGALTAVPNPLRPAWQGSAWAGPSGAPPQRPGGFGPTAPGPVPPAGQFGGAPQGGNPFGAMPPGARGSGDNPYASPDDYGAYAPAGAVAIGPFVPTRIDFSDVLERTWAIFKQRWGICLGVGLLWGLLQFGASFLVNIATAAIAPATGELIGVVVFLCGQLGDWIFSTWIGIGGAIFFLKTARGQSPGVGELFAGGPYLLTVILGSILWALILFGVIGACLLPSGIVAVWLAVGGGGPEGAIAMWVICVCVAVGAIIYISLRFWAWYYAIIDRNCDVIESFRLSSAATRGNKLTVLGVFFVTGLIGLVLIVLTCGLGLLVVWPFTNLLCAVVYLAMTGQQTADGLWAAQWPVAGVPLR